MKKQIAVEVQWEKIKSGMIVRVPDFKKCRGLVPVIVQDKTTGKVFMLGYTRAKEFWESFYTHEAVFWSRSRKRRWKKGEEKSGNILKIHEMYLDCDGDTLLYIVSQSNPEAGVCHTGAPTCFSPVVTSVFEQHGNTTLKIVPLQDSLLVHAPS